MKKIITMVILLFIALPSTAQNFVATERTKTVYIDTTTTFTYEIQGIKYPVCKGKSGAFYIWKVSKKTNRRYKYYLPKEIQIRMGRKYK